MTNEEKRIEALREALAWLVLYCDPDVPGDFDRDKAAQVAADAIAADDRAQLLGVAP